MNIVPVSSVKTDLPFLINSVVKSDDGVDKRLADLGFVAGRNVVVVERPSKDTFKLRVDDDNSIALNGQTASKILVEADERDILPTETSTKNKGIFDGLKKIFAKKN